MLNNIFGWEPWVFAIGDWCITISVSSILEMIFFAVLLYFFINWIRKNKAWSILKGAFILVLFYILSEVLGLDNFSYLFRTLFSSIILALIIIFQPEIRKGLEHLGERNLIKKVLPEGLVAEPKAQISTETLDDICDALKDLSQNHVGALIVLETRENLNDYCKTGISLNAEISNQLLQQIFIENSPLHDGAVIIRENKISAATCYLPLSENPEISKKLGTRHRAAVGVSEATDCIALVASEETGALSVAIKGKLFHNLSIEELRNMVASNSRNLGSRTENLRPKDRRLQKGKRR